jgi:predicted GNAT family N-acyltransferase
VDVLVSLERIAELSEVERGTIRSLTQSVYPPAEMANWPGRHLEWADSEWCIRVWGDDGELASYAGILLREVRHDGRPVLVGGIGGVKTHPAARRRGYAERGLRRAVDFFHENPAVGFALLVCEAHLIPYYVRLGWREFVGQLWVRQHGEAVIFTFNRVMTLGIKLEAPATGRIDLCGPPW